MKYFLFILSLIVFKLSFSQLISQHFSSTAPTGWSSTSNTWVLNYDGNATGNYRGVYDATKYSARFPSASTGNSIYLYIPVTFINTYHYSITFYTKRACNITVITNETADQTSPLSTETIDNASCSSNWGNWYSWTFTTVATYSGSGYIQIKINTVYGGPTSVYLDDFDVTESSALPIELLYFKGRKTNNGNLLQWETASENNNDYFTIYRSKFPLEWVPIIKIDGAGNSVINNKYQFLDSRIENEINYYTLRQTDYDGRYKESEIIAIDNRTPYITPIKIVNTIGQEVSIDYNGLKFITYEDGSVERVY